MIKLHNLDTSAQTNVIFFATSAYLYFLETDTCKPIFGPLSLKDLEEIAVATNYKFAGAFKFLNTAVIGSSHIIFEKQENGGFLADMIEFFKAVCS